MLFRSDDQEAQYRGKMEELKSAHVLLTSSLRDLREMQITLNSMVDKVETMLLEVNAARETHDVQILRRRARVLARIRDMETEIGVGSEDDSGLDVQQLRDSKWARAECTGRYIETLRQVRRREVARQLPRVEETLEAERPVVVREERTGYRQRAVEVLESFERLMHGMEDGGVEIGRAHV